MTYVREAYTRPAVVFAIMLLYMLLYRLMPIESFVVHALGILLTLLIAAGLAFSIGLREGEKRMLTDFLKTKLNRHA